MQQSECGTQKQPTPLPGEGSTAPRAEPKKRIRNKKSFNFINVAAKFRPGHNAAGGTAEKLCLASEKWTANCASGRGREEREGGEKFKMLTVRLSFSAGPGPVPEPGSGEEELRHSVSKTLSSFRWLTKQQTMATGAKERSWKLRYKQSKGHFANGLTFQQVWGPFLNPHPQSASAATTRRATPCRAVFRVAEVVAEAFLTALKHKLQLKKKTKKKPEKK